MNPKFEKIIRSVPLFKGCENHLFKALIADRGTIKIFSPGETVEPSGEPSIGILLTGMAVIYSSNQGKQTILRFLGPGSAFGVASLFASSPPKTRIKACGDGNSEVFFIERKSVEEMLTKETDGTFRRNLITFLSDRVSFLNSRIDTVTAGSAENKLLLYLQNCPRSASGEIDLGMSMTALAHALDIGRASLYRAFDSLVNEGIISKNKGEIIFLHERN